MKCDQCNSAMRHDSTVCSNSSCSARFVCDICGSQRLNTQPMSAGYVAAANWPETSGYNPGRDLSDSPRSRHVLEEPGPRMAGDDEIDLAQDLQTDYSDTATALDARHPAQLAQPQHGLLESIEPVEPIDYID